MPSKSPKTKKTKQKYYEGVGRRKTAIARVRATVLKSTKSPQKNHQIMVNEKPWLNYFTIEKLRKVVEEPLKQIKTLPQLALSIRVSGGGVRAQAEAISLGIARALKEFQPELAPELKTASLLTRDPRMKERKKPGRRGARKGQQWSKR